MDDQTFTQPKMMFSNVVVTGGTYSIVQTINQGMTLRDPLRILQDFSSPSTFHNSGERYDPPKCHANTRVAVLRKIMDWIIGCDPGTRDKWIMWLSGGAGAGKSAIGQTMAEYCDAEGRLLGSFFFGRSDGTRNHAKSLIPTIACQIYANFPATRKDISSIINNDPLIFNKSFLIQLMSLVIGPLKCLGDAVSPYMIIIDGLDECIDRASQVTILRALFDAVERHGCRIRFLVASRPEHDIVNAFSARNVDKILARLVLDDKYQSKEDIKLFLADKFKDIAETHPFRNVVPEEWPGHHVVEEIAEKSSGQFVYASIVVKYVESIRHRPNQRLEIVRNLRPPQGNSDMPFAELDALYTHIFSSVDNPSLVLEIISFIIHEAQVGEPDDQVWGIYRRPLCVKGIEVIHSLEPGSLKILLCDLGALVTVKISHKLEEQDSIEILHASILDFLIDPTRSNNLHIPANILLTRHVTNCLRFLSKNTDGDSIEIVVEFLITYCTQVLFTEDMTSAFDGFSILNILQHDTINPSIKYSLLLQLSPILLEFIRQSDQHKFLSRYLTMLDDSYIALQDTYPPESLALPLSILMHESTFPSLATQVDFRLPPSRMVHDTLWIMQKEVDDTMFFANDYAAVEAHRAALREFLLDPVRSRNYNFQSTAGKMYAQSLLGCFDFLETQLFRYHYCPRFSTDGLQLIPFNQEETKEGLNAAFHGEETNDSIAVKQKRDQTGKEDRDRYFTKNLEDTRVVDTEKDIQAWYKNWHQVVSKGNKDFRYLASKHDPDSLRILWLARYGLMLGYMIYFFPRAGKSQKLMKLCQTTVLRMDISLFPADTVRAQRAMAAYVKRVEELEDIE